MSIHNAIIKAYETAKKRDWDRVYILLDVHGTIAASDYSNKDPDFYPQAIKALKEISRLPEVRIILWTSCYPRAIGRITTQLVKHGIRVDAANKSLIENTKTGDFSGKPYFSILIDDKAGFDPLIWPEVVETFNRSRELYLLRGTYCTQCEEMSDFPSPCQKCRKLNKKLDKL